MGVILFIAIILLIYVLQIRWNLAVYRTTSAVQ